ncbi:uncharacterized protein LY89DRAFT_244634 [Mollisia scopiformis]|uniref:Uncharacterized protein n=1 Tax=Mollisia scopiformis TaxID=149040 RepID=A0A194WSL1_MOLSC|nr:uncharacterized protein LY89DRAFT_244634 [Mollisia scopiformis]KUJ10602.1 hypothetical protein LY89DRAFT_244634 [Mollisia scopiformis]
MRKQSLHWFEQGGTCSSVLVCIRNDWTRRIASSRNLELRSTSPTPNARSLPRIANRNSTPSTLTITLAVKQSKATEMLHKQTPLVPEHSLSMPPKNLVVERVLDAMRGMKPEAPNLYVPCHLRLVVCPET